MDLRNFIYYYNLNTTLTCKKGTYPECDTRYDNRKATINYKNSISFYDLVKIFNDHYMAYLEDINTLDMITSTLGEEVKYVGCSHYDGFSALTVDVYNPYPNIFDEDYTEVVFFQRDGKYGAYANNRKPRIDKNFKTRELNLDSEDIISCINIVEKYHLFLKCFEDVEDKFIYGNGCTVLFSKIDGDILKGLSTFTLTFGNAYMNTSDYIEVKFNLGEKLEIIYDESKVIFHDEEVLDKDKKKEIIDELVNKLYISCDKLNNLYNTEKSKLVLKREKDIK